jgi:hypothetical protein
MLIIAIPKSASTSLMKTLGELYNLPAKQTFFPDQKPPADYSHLWKYHGDIRQITPRQAAKFARRKTIYKQHIPPTRQNRKLLHDVKKVILLRRPIDILSAYFRGAKKGVHNTLADFKDVKTKDECIERAESIGLLDELRQFRQTWKQDTGRKLIITYQELTQSPQKTIARIEDYWDLPVVNQDVELAKERFSRISTPQVLLNKIYWRPVKNLASLIKRLITKP